MSKWEELDMDKKIAKILDVQSYDPSHHFGRPFLTPYQIAIKFERDFSEEFKMLKKPVGGEGNNRQDSLTQYIALELSQRIKNDVITNIEGRFLHRESLDCLKFKGNDGNSVVSKQSYDLSMFRLKKNNMEFKKLTPNFSVRDVRETVKFYQDKLFFKLEMAVRCGTTVIEKVISEKYEYAYAMMSKDEVYVMFLKTDNFVEDISVLKGFPQGASVLFYIDVENIDEVYTKLKGHVEIAKDLERTWYGMREFYIKDCNGYVIGFAEKE